MKISLIFSLLISLNFGSNAQKRGEMTVNFLYGAIIRNDLGGTSENYNDYSEYSGANMKCTSNNGVSISYLGFLNQSKWFLSGAFENRWLKYTTTIYSDNYDPNGQFNKKADLTLRNEYSRFSFGGGRRFAILNEKLFWDIGIGSNLNFNWDNTISEGEITQYSFNLQPTAIQYEVNLNFKDYDQKLNFYLNNSLNYFPTQKVGIQFICNWTNPIVVGDYSFIVKTRGIPQEISPGFTITSNSIDKLSPGRIITKYLTFGLGLTCKI